jgi:hypothetical protein
VRRPALELPQSLSCARLERRKGEIARELDRAIDTIVKAGIDPTTLAGADLEMPGQSAATPRSRRRRRGGAPSDLGSDRAYAGKPANSEKLEIEIRGRLEELLAAPTFMARSAGGALVVAGEGLEPPTPGL